MVHCHRGCETEAILAALSLDMSDLFVNPVIGTRTPQRQHIYTDESGKELYRLRKFAPRRWATYRPDPSSEGGWSPGMGDVRRVLYRLPDILNRPYDDPVWCCEGERDADTAARLGMVATTALGNGWRKADLSPLLGRQCVVVCDRDQAGYTQGRRRAAALRAGGAVVVDDDLVAPRAVKDLADLVEAVGAVLYDVLEEFRPISETAELSKRRSIEERASPYAIVPKELLGVSILARGVYLTLDLLAGKTGTAKLSMAGFAEQERVGVNQAAKAFHELEAAGLIFQMRRGNWQVVNSQRSRKSTS